MYNTPVVRELLFATTYMYLSQKDGVMSRLHLYDFCEAAGEACHGSAQEAREAHAPLINVSPYHCNFCGTWHVGMRTHIHNGHNNEDTKSA